MILPYMEQQVSFNAINFDYAAWGQLRTLQNGQPPGAVNHTGLATVINSLICPADSPSTPLPNLLLNPTGGVTYNAYSQSSYAGVVGTRDVFRWWCGCPPTFVDGFVCTGQISLRPDGVFGYDTSYGSRDITDGLSNTLLVGEFARFRNDPDLFFNQWSIAIYFLSSLPGVTRPQGLATTVPRINADLKVPDVTETPAVPEFYSPIGWRDDPRNLNFGQFGFRSQHPGGANFLFGDGSVHFLSQTIDHERVYWPLSTRDGGEIVSSDAY
jgi:prepilin-type processing-associated H-X9-DG protein